MTSPVIRVVHSRAKDGCHAAYEALILGMFESMKHFPGFLGSELLPLKVELTSRSSTRFQDQFNLNPPPLFLVLLLTWRT
jgi:antibiotic biosynthesis monooxygenase (ABM) superfamily enzyme